MIEVWFPTLIYKENLGPLVDNQELYKKALELKQSTPKARDWDAYSTLAAVNIRDDPLILDLISKCKVHVLNFVRELGANEFKSVRCSECWFNLYEKNDYQEVHTHMNSHISLVYYVKVPTDSGNIVFNSPTYLTDLFRPSFTRDVTTATYTPGESDVMIFKSNVAHRVTPNKTDEHRVSIAMNFILDS